MSANDRFNDTIQDKYEKYMAVTRNSNYVSCSHGCRVRIGLSQGEIRHYDEKGFEPALVRSYAEGMRIGCTFITNEALDTIWECHKSYINRKDEVTHQNGVS